MRLVAAVLLVLAGGAFESAAQDPVLPHQAGSLKFAAIGDNGTGEAAEYEVARQMASRHGTFPFELVIMLGDNLYGRQRAGATEVAAVSLRRWPSAIFCRNRVMNRSAIAGS